MNLSESAVAPPPKDAETESDVLAFSPEGMAALLWTVAADVLIFRTGTYVAVAIFLICVPAILRIAGNRGGSMRIWFCVGGLAVAIAMRLVWQGSPLTLVSAVAVVVAMAMAAHGDHPWVIEGITRLLRCVFDGAQRLSKYRWTTRTVEGLRRHDRAAAILLPIVAAVVFGTIFIMANPDWVAWSGDWISRSWTRIVRWIEGFSAWEVPFCVLALLAGVGLMRPRSTATRSAAAPATTPSSSAAIDPAASDLYHAYRNTIMTLIVLFAGYLTAELTTLWFQKFPPNFYYAGYAHHGAAWLTLALILATVSLSIIFGRSLRHDPRLPFIRRLAWIWSGLNFVLVLAVYHRLSIYVGYNGLTRMRIVGYFGVTLVAVGFALVVWKISKDRGFWWLVRSQLLAMVIAIIVHSLTPIDYIAHRYNVARINGGDLAPSVMIAVKPINDEGLLTLFSLLDHPNDLIRQGVAARIVNRFATDHSPSSAIAGYPAAAHRYGLSAATAATPTDDHWTAFQGSTSMLHQRWLQYQQNHPSIDLRARDDASLQRFRDYAMRWY